MIERYIAENPEKIVDSVRAYNRRVEDGAGATPPPANLVALRDEILADPGSPVGRQPRKATLRIVEFFDYRCGYCKRSLDVIDDSDARKTRKCGSCSRSSRS